jgi:hypothetical protein
MYGKTTDRWTLHAVSPDDEGGPQEEQRPSLPLITVKTPCTLWQF